MLSLLIYIICILFGNVLIYSLSSKGITLFFGGFLKAVMQVIQMVHTVQLSSERWLRFEFIVFSPNVTFIYPTFYSVFCYDFLFNLLIQISNTIVYSHLNIFFLLSLGISMLCSLLTILASGLYWMLSTIICKEVGLLMNILSLIRS